MLSIAVLSMVGLELWAHSILCYLTVCSMCWSCTRWVTVKGELRLPWRGKQSDQAYKEAREPVVSFLPFSTFFVGTVRSKSIKRNFYIQPLPPFLPGTAEQSCGERQMIGCLVAVLTCRSQFPCSHRNGICCHSQHSVLSLYHQYRWI